MTQRQNFQYIIKKTKNGNNLKESTNIGDVDATEKLNHRNQKESNRDDVENKARNKRNVKSIKISPVTVHWNSGYPGCG